MKGCGFHLSHYEESLKRWIHEGYACVGFRETGGHGDQGKLLVLRHDLDFRRCIPNGLRMAEIEHGLGAHATYFVRLHSEDYNPMEYTAYLTLKSILALGHEIGLHFECYELSEVSGEREEDLFRKGKRVLEELLDIEVVSACEHGDYHRFESAGFKRFFERYDREAFGISFDPYDPLYFKGMKYLSDSNQNWREGCFCGHVGRYPRVHVATHPGLWYERHYVLG
jgi:hypothetical protein